MDPSQVIKVLRLEVTMPTIEAMVGGRQLRKGVGYPFAAFLSTFVKIHEFYDMSRPHLL